MMLDVSYTMQRGPHHAQQDCMLTGSHLHQEANVPPRSVGMSADNTLFAVADGVSASPFPAMASCYALEALRNLQAQREADGVADLVDGRIVRHMHAELCRRLGGHPRTRGSATTIAIAHFNEGRLRVLNVGDSRVWLRRASGELIQLSKDHSVLQGMIDRGEAEPGIEYASIYNGLEHALIADSEVDDFAIHFTTVDVATGDEVILCSDGIVSTLGERHTRELLAASNSPRERLEQCRVEIIEKGAVDDCSMIAVVMPRQGVPRPCTT